MLYINFSLYTKKGQIKIATFFDFYVKKVKSMSNEQKLSKYQSKIEHDIKVGLADNCMTQRQLADAIGCSIWNVNRAIKGSAGDKFDGVRNKIYRKLNIKP